MNYRKEVDGLRALAILLVISFHAFGLKGGFVGVDIFFVISGFLISTLLFDAIHRKQFTFFDFYLRRIIRILPALITVLVFCIAVGWFVLLGDEYSHLGKHVAGSSLFVSNALLLQESGYFDTLSEAKILLHLWSLSIEEQFYIFWPLILVLLAKYVKNVAGFLLVILICSLAYCVYLTYHSPFAAFYSPFSRVWELIAGALLAIRLRTLSNPYIRFSNWVSALGFISIIVAVVMLNPTRYFPGFWAILPTAGTCFILLAGSDSALNRALLTNKVMRFFGLISYPLYLWHWPLLSFANILQSGRPDGVIRACAVLLSIALAWLTTVYIENPIRFKSNRTITAPILVTTLFIIGFSGLNLYSYEGFNWRFNEEVTQINTFAATNRQSCTFVTGERFGNDWCYEGKGKINTVLLGDSYSNSYAEMLLRYSQENTLISFTQIGRGQCPALMDYGPKYCRTLFRQSFDFVASNNNIKHVILAADWSAYIHGKKYADTNDYEDATHFKQALEKTIKSYQAIGKNIIVFLSPPNGANPKSCIPRPIRLSQKNICTLALSTAEKKEKHYRDYLIPLMKKEQISYFDPYDFLCDKNALRCKIALDNKLFYLEDGAHLSNHGGDYLALQGKTTLDALF